MTKKRLSQQQEFEIMKLVLDKFLWVGFGIMVYGVWRMFTGDIPLGLGWAAAGAIILVLFLIIIVREYEIVK